MVNLTTCELRLIAEKRNIKDYQKMPREELLRTFDESERFLKKFIKNLTRANSKNTESFIK